MTIFYKVVDVKNGKYVSVVAGAEAQVVYEPGKVAEAPKWLRREGYGLCVFSGLEHAQEFTKRHNAHAGVWEVKVVGPWREPSVQMGWTHSIENGELDPCADGCPWPPGTVMADKLVLVRKVWPNAREIE